MTPEVKESNPKDSIGSTKVAFSTVSAPVLAEVAVAMTEGAIKYRRHNYRAVGVRASTYYDACLRHITAWWEGEDIDAESGLSHITKSIASLFVLRDAMIRDKMVDDRPPGTLGFIRKMNEATKKLMGRFPEHERPYVQADVEGGPDDVSRYYDEQDQLPAMMATTTRPEVPDHDREKNVKIWVEKIAEYDSPRLRSSAFSSLLKTVKEGKPLAIPT